MKKTVLITAAAFALAISACHNSSTEDKQQSATIDTTKIKKGDVYYQCEMNPEVLSDKPGSCSKCGMDLEKKEKK
ncbi:MAG: heavy metal-binding domain-containing protein [Bacteroidia bacterium]